MGFRPSPEVDAITKVCGDWRRCGPLPNYFGHLMLVPIFLFAISISADTHISVS